MKRSIWLCLILGAVAVTVLVLWLLQRFPGALDDQTSKANLAYLLVWLSLLGASAILHARSRPGTALRSIAVWLAIGFVLVLAYSYRDQFAGLRARLAGELLPQQGVATGEDSITFRARDDGHFHVEAMVDGIPVLFLVDTGASDVVLSPSDAERLGFDLARLSYTQRYQTANGTGRGAPVRLDEIVIGPVRVADLRASVNEAPMARSLLGMSFLGRLGGYAVEGQRLTLRR